MMTMTRLFLQVTLGAAALGSTLALAGKPERDKATELKPAIAAAEKTVNDSCGCPVTLAVKWDTYTKADDMRRITDDANEFAKSAKKQCNSPENKAAMCKALKSVEISFQAGTLPKPELSGTTIISHSNGMSFNGAASFSAIMDKF
jgi:hypothetical protein